MLAKFYDIAKPYVNNSIKRISTISDSISGYLTKKSEANERISRINDSLNYIVPHVIIQIINDYAYEFYSKNKPDILTNIYSNPEDSYILHVKISNDLIVTGFLNSNLDIWKIETYCKDSLQCTKINHINTIKAHAGYLSYLAIHPHGFVVSNSFWSIKIWDPMTGNLLNELKTVGNDHRICFMSDGSIVSGTHEGIITIWKPGINNSYIPRILPNAGPNNNLSLVQLEILDYPIERIFMIIGYTRVYVIWNPDLDVWDSHSVSCYISYVSKMYRISDVMTISLGYDKTSCIDLIDIWTNQNLLTLHTKYLSCYRVVKLAECQKYRVIAGSLYGEIKVWDTEKCNDKMFKQLVFVCELGGFTIFNDMYPINSIQYLSDQKIAVSMNNVIKIISLESINGKNTNTIDVLEENQVCERYIKSNNIINKTFVISDTIIFFTYLNEMTTWR